MTADEAARQPSKYDRPVIMQIVGLINGRKTAFDGQYLVEYDPERDGTDPDGQPMIAHVQTTTDRTQAKVFASAVDALEEWRRQCKRNPLRADGKANRPLAAFTVETMPL